MSERAWTAADYRRDAEDQQAEHNAAMAQEARDAYEQGAEEAGFHPPVRSAPSRLRSIKGQRLYGSYYDEAGDVGEGNREWDE